MENILRAFAKESARIGNRYKPENQRVITFGINGNEGKVEDGGHRYR